MAVILKKTVFFIFGVFLAVLGLAFVFLPVLPGSVFIAAGLLLMAKSSQRAKQKIKHYKSIVISKWKDWRGQKVD
jgi:uncharacterized membrane protein YbaN (DUF454 family)